MDFSSIKLLVPTKCQHLTDNNADAGRNLNCFGFGKNKPSQTSKFHGADEPHLAKVSNDSCRLFLGLGPTPSTYLDSSYTVKVMEDTRKTSNISSEERACDNECVILKLGLSTASDHGECPGEGSAFTPPDQNSSSYSCDQMHSSLNGMPVPVVDEGSTSAKRISGGYMSSLLLAPRPEVSTKKSLEVNPFPRHFSPEPSATTVCSFGSISRMTATRTASDSRGHHPKKCRFNGCAKGARGASGLCIAHGGGQRCQKNGCSKGAESRTAYCKAHGGGRRCQQLGCTKSAEGKTDYCIAHGGGRRCGFSGGCTKAARGKSGLCIKHGGGKRCKIEGCTRSAEGQAGLCISHGGGRRCLYPDCTKGAQGSTMYCKAHGGGKRCIFAGCTKGAEGSTPLCKGHGGGKRCLFNGGGVCPKSVHGGTDYCVAHGGGKRCAIPGCTKSARGRTDYCVRHGGGKRCRVENCGKSAQGSTDFCKAHGGGKRCNWGSGICDKFARGKSGLCAAHATMAHEKEREKMNKGGMISPGLFHGVVSASTMGSGMDNDYSSGMSAVSECLESDSTTMKQLIPPQVLVPLSMKSASFTEKGEGSGGDVRSNNCNYVVPEGRVHGGVLMSLFGGNLRNAADEL